MTKRAIRINDTEFELSKATALNSDYVKILMHIDELPDGTYRLTYNSKKIPDFTKVKFIEVIREDD